MSVGDPGWGDRGRGHRVAPVLAVVLAVLLVVVLLWPDGWVLNRAVVRVYVFFLDRGMPQRVTPEDYAVVLNVAVFVPLGWIGVALLRWPPAGVAWTLTAASVAVELVQALPIVGRDPSLLDVASNALGAVLGVVAASVVGRRRHRQNGAVDDQPGVEEPGDERGDVGGDHLGG